MANKTLEDFQRRLKDLHIENETLRGQLANSSKMYGSSVSPQTIIQLQSRNERLERQALKFSKSIKQDLSTYLSDSLVQGECFYRNRYNRLLNQPRNHYKLYF